MCYALLTGNCSPPTSSSTNITSSTVLFYAWNPPSKPQTPLSTPASPQKTPQTSAAASRILCQPSFRSTQEPPTNSLRSTPPLLNLSVDLFGEAVGPPATHMTRPTTTQRPTLLPPSLTPRFGLRISTTRHLRQPRPQAQLFLTPHGEHRFWATPLSRPQIVYCSATREPEIWMPFSTIFTTHYRQ